MGKQEQFEGVRILKEGRDQDEEFRSRSSVHKKKNVKQEQDREYEQKQDKTQGFEQKKEQDQEIKLKKVQDQ